MTEIVERLRIFAQHYEICGEAADELERLREELAMLARAKFGDEETIAEQADEIERLRAALLFYAERTVESEDGGVRARDALGNYADSVSDDYLPIEGAPLAFRPPGTTKRK